MILSTGGSILLGVNVLLPRLWLSWYEQAEGYIKERERAEKYFDLIDPDKTRPGREADIDLHARIYFRDSLTAKAQKVGYIALGFLIVGLILQLVVRRCGS